MPPWTTSGTDGPRCMRRCAAASRHKQRRARTRAALSQWTNRSSRPNPEHARPLASAFDDVSTRRRSTQSSLAGAGGLAATQSDLPAIRATTHVEGKAIGSSRRRTPAARPEQARAGPALGALASGRERTRCCRSGLDRVSASAARALAVTVLSAARAQLLVYLALRPRGARAGANSPKRSRRARTDLGRPRARQLVRTARRDCDRGSGGGLEPLRW
jgi:hypothetical protein